jgi:hypothetical protein
MGKSSGGGGTTTTEFKPPEYTQQGWKDYISGVQNMTNQPYQAYQGQTIAEPNEIQNQAADFTRQRALYGAPDLNAGRGQVTDTAMGGYLNSNPWLQNGYTEAVIGQNAQNMAKAYSVGGAAQLDASAARGRAFGGSGYAEQNASNQAGLAGQIGQMANNLQLQRMGMGSQDWQNERSNMMAASNLAGQLSQDDWRAATALSGVGDFYQNYTQKLMDSQLNEFNQQKMYPFQMADIFGNALSRGSGGMGSNTQMTNVNTQMSPLALALGLGGAAYSGYKLGG